MWSRNNRSMNSADLRARDGSVDKDENLRLDAFSAAPKLFSGKRLSISERIDLFMVDYDFIPLLVHQAFPNAVQRAATAGDLGSGDTSERAKARLLQQAADAVAESDIVSGHLRGRQMWGLLPAMAVCNVRVSCAGQLCVHIFCLLI